MDAERVRKHSKGADYMVLGKKRAQEQVTSGGTAQGETAAHAGGTSQGNKAANSKKSSRKTRKGMNDFQYFALQALTLVVIVYVLFGHIVSIMTAPNADMYPRIDSGDFLLVYRLDKDPKAQDVMVFEKNGTRYVGRVVAVGGDTVEVTDGAVKINGYTMVETNIFYDTYPLEGFTEYPLQLAADECFVLADQRKGTEDSRFFGPVKYNELDGTVISVIRRNNL